MQSLLLTCVAFFVGSIPTGLVLTRAVAGVDVRDAGSGNVGAANVARTAGFRIGILVALLDIAKGAVPVLAARAVGLDSTGLAVVALAAVLGHDYSLFLGMRGGKGVATTLGVMLALTPIPALIAIGTYVAVMLAFRYSSLASLAALTLLPAYVTGLGEPRSFVLLAVLLWAIGVFKHRQNIARLLQGKESRFRLHGH
jgi:glycerol-3-phosphate acyltransferase PlsY